MLKVFSLINADHLKAVSLMSCIRNLFERIWALWRFVIVLEAKSKDALWSLRVWHGQQQYSYMLWHLNQTQLVLRDPRCAKKMFPNNITPAAAAWTVDTRQDSSIVQLEWACVNCSFSLLFLAVTSSTQCGLLLLNLHLHQGLTVVHSEMLFCVMCGHLYYCCLPISSSSSQTNLWFLPSKREVHLENCSSPNIMDQSL